MVRLFVFVLVAVGIVDNIDPATIKFNVIEPDYLYKLD